MGVLNAVEDVIGPALEKWGVCEAVLGKVPKYSEPAADLKAKLADMEVLLTPRNDKYPLVDGAAPGIADLALAAHVAAMTAAGWRIWQEMPAVWRHLSAVRDKLNEMHASAGYWKRTGSQWESQRGAFICTLLQSRVTQLNQHPALNRLEMERTRIAAELPNSFLGRWMLTPTYDASVGQLRLHPGNRFDRITVTQDRPGQPSMYIAQSGRWVLRMPTNASNAPTIELHVLRWVIRDGDGAIERDDAVPRGLMAPAGKELDTLKFKVQIRGKMWGIERHEPALPLNLFEDLQSIFECCDKEFLDMARKVLEKNGATALEKYVSHLRSHKAMTRFREVSITKKAARIHQGLDADRSGTLDREELRAFDHRGRIFDQLDQDQNGDVTLEELTKYFIHTKKNRELIDSFIDHLDATIKPKLPPPKADLLSRTPIFSTDFSLMPASSN